MSRIKVKKGKLIKKEEKWFVRYRETTPLSITTETLPLYPDDAKRYQNEYDYYGAIGFKGEEVEFEIVEHIDKCKGLVVDDMCFMETPAIRCGCVKSYAKLINHFSDIRKMVEDDVKTTTSDLIDAVIWSLPFDERMKCWDLIEKLVEEEKETLYTEEQVRDIVLKFAEESTFLRQGIAIKWVKDYFKSLKKSKL